VGIDTPSVDLADDKQLFVHHAIYEYDMAILEGIVLDQVIDGLYELIALPLKIKNGDASPVRAILKNLNKDHDAN
jgi:arylformamidase